MKKATSSVILGIILSFMALATRPATAMGLSIGAYGWGAWWDPFYKKYVSETKQVFPLVIFPLKKRYAMDPTVLAGPLVSIKFNEKYTWSNVLVIGKYHTRTGQILYFHNPYSSQASAPMMTPTKMSMPQMKYDLDSTHSITMTGFMKLFVGIKYQHYTFDRQGILPVISPTSVAIFYNKSTLVYNGIGAGLGLSFNVPLTGGLFLIANASALAQYPLIEDRQPKSTNFLFTRNSIGEIFYLPLGRNKMVDGYYQIGGNAALSLAYYIEKASLTIAMGGRYQYLHLFGKDASGGQYAFAGKDDHFYGATMSVIYNFEFQQKDATN